MSIKEVDKKSKPSKALPNEEEFDIVSTDFTAQSRTKINDYLLYGLIVLLLGSISFGVGKLVKNSNSKDSIVISYEESNQTEVASPKEIVSKIVQKVVPAPQQTIPQPKPTKQTLTNVATTLTSGPIVASKNGAKYYLTTCSGAKRISEANKVYFATEQDAKNSGRTPSSTCKGLK